MRRKTIVIVLFTVLTVVQSTISLFAEKEARITVNLDEVEPNIVTENLFGVFFEYQSGRIAGRMGYSAEALYDRGFDFNRTEKEIVNEVWKPHNKSGDSEFIFSTENSYNPNGWGHRKITNTKPGSEAGLYQYIYLENQATYSFFVHMRGNLDTGNVNLSLIDSVSGEVVFRRSVGSPGPEWEKFELAVPKLEDAGAYKFLLSFSDTGYVEFDEASMLADDHQYTMSKRFIESVLDLNPGIIRFPGGCFVDYHSFYWKEHIGDRDFRRAPNYWWDWESLRMDFSIDEFLQFCEEHQIEALLTVNYHFDSPENAADFVEYCNGDISTEYGKLRADNGHPEPYNVKYWEVGNEQWSDSLYPVKYLDYYDAMKEVDPGISITVNGNHWAGEDDFKKIFPVIKEKADIYSWHPTLFNFVDSPYSDDTLYYNIMCLGKLQDYYIGEIEKNMGKYTDNYELKHAPNEWWVDYPEMGKGPKPWIDSTWKNRTLESGLANAQFILSTLRRPELIEMSCRTLFLGFLQRGTDINGKRVFYNAPGYYAFKMLSNHTGSHKINYKLNVDTMPHAPRGKDLHWVNDIPMLDVAVTASEDSLYIAVLNRHISEPYHTVIPVDAKYVEPGEKGKVYTLYSDNYLDFNSPDNPEIIRDEVSEFTFTGDYVFPEHSLTILAIPLDGFTDIEEPETAGDFFIYPNPADGYFEIKTQGIVFDEIFMYDMNGKQVYYLSPQNLASKGNRNRINTSQMAPGVYMLKGKAGEETFIRKVIVIR